MWKVVGPGPSHVTDFAQFWGGYQRLWMNPPYSCLDKVVVKIFSDQGHGVLVVPDWPRTR